MKVLVLGWEYPPAVAGGLGAACHGLTTALADRGHEVILCTPADGAPADPAPYPGIERVSLGGDASFSPFHPGAVLDPYAVDTAPGSASASGSLVPPVSSGAAVAGAASVEAGSTGLGSSRPDSHAQSARKLYGEDLSTAIQRYSREAVTRLKGRDFDVVHAHDWMTFPAALRLRFARPTTRVPPRALHGDRPGRGIRAGAGGVHQRGGARRAPHGGSGLRGQRLHQGSPCA